MNAQLLLHHGIDQTDMNAKDNTMNIEKYEDDDEGVEDEGGYIDLLHEDEGESIVLDEVIEQFCQDMV